MPPEGGPLSMGSASDRGFMASSAAGRGGQPQQAGWGWRAALKLDAPAAPLVAQESAAAALTGWGLVDGTLPDGLPAPGYSVSSPRLAPLPVYRHISTALPPPPGPNGFRGSRRRSSLYGTVLNSGPATYMRMPSMSAPTTPALRDGRAGPDRSGPFGHAGGLQQSAEVNSYLVNFPEAPQDHLRPQASNYHAGASSAASAAAGAKRDPIAAALSASGAGVRAAGAPLGRILRTTEVVEDADGAGSSYDWGPRLSDGYRVGQALLRPSHGRHLFRCVAEATGEKLAVMTITKTDLPSVLAARTELSIMELLAGHPCILRLRDALEDEGHLHVVTDSQDGGTLEAELERGPLSEPRAALYFRCMARGLAHAHTQGVMHRAIRPSSVVLAPPLPSADAPAAAAGPPEACVLGDFSLACFFDKSSKLADRLGSIFYLSPEAVAREAGPESDTWALGVCLFEMLSGRRPFTAPTVAGTLAAVARAQPVMDGVAWAKITPEAQDLVKQLLMADPAARLPVRAILEHPWIVKHHATSAATREEEHELRRAAAMGKSFTVPKGQNLGTSSAGAVLESGLAPIPGSPRAVTTGPKHGPGAEPSLSRLHSVRRGSVLGGLGRRMSITPTVVAFGSSQLDLGTASTGNFLQRQLSRVPLYEHGGGAHVNFAARAESAEVGPRPSPRGGPGGPLESPRGVLPPPGGGGRRMSRAAMAALAQSMPSIRFAEEPSKPFGRGVGGRPAHGAPLGSPQSLAERQKIDLFLETFKAMQVAPYLRLLLAADEPAVASATAEFYEGMRGVEVLLGTLAGDSATAVAVANAPLAAAAAAAAMGSEGGAGAAGVGSLDGPGNKSLSFGGEPGSSGAFGIGGSQGGNKGPATPNPTPVMSGVFAKSPACPERTPAYFLGSVDEPSQAEAATAPLVLRMAVTLAAVRNLDIVQRAGDLSLPRLRAWLTKVLADPAKAGAEAASLSPDSIVRLARKLWVGCSLPSPSPFAHELNWHGDHWRGAGVDTRATVSAAGPRAAGGRLTLRTAAGAVKMAMRLSAAASSSVDGINAHAGALVGRRASIVPRSSKATTFALPDVQHVVARVVTRIPKSQGAKKKFESAAESTVPAPSRQFSGWQNLRKTGAIK